MPGGDSSGDGSGRTKVMDGFWNPRRVNCWPLHVRLGDTLALPRPRKSMHPCVLSRTPPIPSVSSSSSFLHLHRYHYLHRHVAVANPYSLPDLYNSLFPSLSRKSAGPLFFAPEKGELGGVGDVRLLHYVFLTEPPLTSTLSPPLDSLSLRRSFFSLSPPFPVLSRCYLSAFLLQEPRTNPFRC